MKKISCLTLLVILFFLSVAYAASDIPVIPIYTEKDGNSNIEITPTSPQFTIQLASNPTTGYQWKLKKQNLEWIKLIAYDFRPSEKKLIGAPGISSWTFEVTAKGFSEAKSISLQFDYARPWEKNTLPIKQQLFKIVR